MAENLDALEELQSDLLMDLLDAVENMYGDYGGITGPKINQVKKVLGHLEKTLDTENSS